LHSVHLLVFGCNYIQGIQGQELAKGMGRS
jgi:hypothetical protein